MLTFYFDIYVVCWISIIRPNLYRFHGIKRTYIQIKKNVCTPHVAIIQNDMSIALVYVYWWMFGIGIGIFRSCDFGHTNSHRMHCTCICCIFPSQFQFILCIVLIFLPNICRWLVFFPYLSLYLLLLVVVSYH